MIDQGIEPTLLSAITARLRADKESAIAELLVYLRNPVAIGDHPGFLDEMNKLLGAAAEADEKLKLLESMFTASAQ